MSTPTEWLVRLAEHRMPAFERASMASFLEDITRNWVPHGAADRALQRRSQLVHVATCLTVGGLSLFSAGVAGLMTTAGTVVIALSPPPPRAGYDTGVPTWLGLFLAAGILSLSVEAIRSPRRVQSRFAALVGAPLLVGTVGAAATMHVVLVWDVVLLVSLVAGGLGCVATSLGRIIDKDRATRAGLGFVGLAALGVAVSDSRWTTIYAIDGDSSYAVGCALSAVGALFMANGLIFSRLDGSCAPSPS